MGFRMNLSISNVDAPKATSLKSGLQISWDHIFLDMAVLVEAQGDMLDNIESQVSSAVDHVQSGTTALQKAKKLQKNSRKWTCIAIIILLLVTVIIVVAVLKPWSKNGA
ncbi:hypothetical protein ACLOJK_024385 [Asimina triloba]